MVFISNLLIIAVFYCVHQNQVLAFLHDMLPVPSVSGQLGPLSGSADSEHVEIAFNPFNPFGFGEQPEPPPQPQYRPQTEVLVERIPEVVEVIKEEIEEDITDDIGPSAHHDHQDQPLSPAKIPVMPMVSNDMPREQPSPAYNHPVVKEHSPHRPLHDHSVAHNRPFAGLNEPAVASSPCDNPLVETMTVKELCSLPPDKGTGDDDIYRVYFNPTVYQCLPFSYTGVGGNANRFVSIKNCYEICHPAEASVKKPRVVSGIKAYLIPSPTCDSQGMARDMVVRQMANPADPSKTLTIVQTAEYMVGVPQGSNVVIDDGSGTTKIVPTLAPKVKIVERVFQPSYGGYGGYGNDYPSSRDNWSRNSRQYPRTLSSINYGSYGKK